MKKVYHLLMALVMILTAPFQILFKRRMPLDLQFFADPALEDISQGFNISDIVAAVITTDTKSYLFKTASEASVKPVIDQGQEKRLRKLNKIHAVNKTEDIIVGYDIDLTSVLMHFELLAILEGGVATFNTGAFASYTAPAAGTIVVKTPFRLDLYSANKDTAGDDDGYLKWSFPHCKGKPAEFSLKDGDFFLPKMPLYNRPDEGTEPMEITPAAAIPVVA